MREGTKEKTNKQFMILSALAIVFVVDAHAWSPLAIFTQFFPYNSFFMPMFVFISGYFFNEKHLEKPLNYCKKKIIKLLVPYCLIMTMFFYLMWIVTSITPISYRTQITMPSWFVPALFGVNISWFLLRYLFKKWWNEYVATVFLCIIGTVCVYLSKQGLNKTDWLPVLKVGFLMQFYQIGVLYRNKIQRYFEKIPTIIVIILTISINTMLQYITMNRIYFNNIHTMSGFLTDIYVLPLITSITGISFWLSISKKLEPVLGENRLVNYISNHTYTIMMFHMSFFVIYNFVISRIPFVAKDFNFDTFYISVWYHYKPIYQFRVFYTFVGVFGPLGLHYLYEKIARYVKELLKKHTRIKFKE